MDFWRTVVEETHKFQRKIRVWKACEIPQIVFNKCNLKDEWGKPSTKTLDWKTRKAQ
jgi:hypothetical protein